MSWNVSTIRRGYHDPRCAADEALRRIFSSLPRADQRGWAELYVRGIIGTSRKKSLRNIAEAVGMPGAVPSFQQFISQSPWDWEGVAADLRQEVLRSRAPEVWVMDCLAVPKRGRLSVGVERQFVPRIGRTVNSQVGVGLFHVSRSGSLPVSWRLLLPRRWLGDQRLRALARVPPATARGR
ncbi:transposase [Streptomyces smyrnaeus]|uniref:IS701 family transposase n=1 Tax=Streptomyces smyrnaeus TaxID=1387713 RepID=UPI0033B227AD